LVAYPFGNVLCRGVEGDYLIDVLVVQLDRNLMLDKGEIYDHSIFVQLFGFAINGNDPIVTV
jgi:hypothetical protein